MKSRLIGGGLGVLLGVMLGMGTEIVGAFGGIPGVLVFGILGLIIGVVIVPDITRLLQNFRSQIRRLRRP